MWRIEKVDYLKSSYIDELLRAGWEPFAATSVGEWDYIWLRIKIEKYNYD